MLIIFFFCEINTGTNRLVTVQILEDKMVLKRLVPVLWVWKQIWYCGCEGIKRGKTYILWSLREGCFYLLTAHVLLHHRIFRALFF